LLEPAPEGDLLIGCETRCKCSQCGRELHVLAFLSQSKLAAR
jgi:hypothetical protein